MKTNVVFGLGLLSLAMVGGCGGGEQLSWEQFQTMIYREPDTGMYIVNGDELISTERGLRELYDQLVAREALTADKVAAVQQSLIVNLVDGQDDKWDGTTAMNLTYCVSKPMFGAHYDRVVEALDSATAEWEAAAHVNYIHDVSQDDTCSPNSAVVFDVRLACAGRYAARSFFPSTSRINR